MNRRRCQISEEIMTLTQTLHIFNILSLFTVLLHILSHIHNHLMLQFLIFISYCPQKSPWILVVLSFINYTPVKIKYLRLFITDAYLWCSIQHFYYPRFRFSAIFQKMFWNHVATCMYDIVEVQIKTRKPHIKFVSMNNDNSVQISACYQLITFISTSSQNCRSVFYSIFSCL